MSAFLLTAEITRLVRGSSAIVSIIFFGASEAQAIEIFEQHLGRAYSDPQDPIHIDNITTVPLYEHLLTETGPVPCETALKPHAQEEAEAAQADMGAGWWADCDQLVRCRNLASDIEGFRRSLPADIEPDLNWAAENTHTFLIRVIQVPEVKPVEEYIGDEEPVEEQAAQEKTVLAVLVSARNAPLAAWIWRNHMRNSPECAKPIVVEPCCELVQVKGEQTPQ